MARREPRADEQAALEAILAIAGVDGFEWLSVTHVRKPDLRLRLADGRIVFAEITLTADQAAEDLKGAARKMRPFRTMELSWDWKVWVSDDHPREWDELGRSLKDVVKAMVPVLARIESESDSPEEMQRNATATFDPQPHHLSRYFPGGPRHRWMHETLPGMSFEDWAQAVFLPNCDYWFVPDLEDCVLHELEPRRIRVVKSPTRATGHTGSIEVHATPTQPAFSFSAADNLIPAVEAAVSKKQERDQMAGYDGDHWLAVAVEGNAAAQLEEACAPKEPASPRDLSSVRFDGYDELWVIGCTFSDWRFAVARFSEPGEQPTLLTAPRPPKT